MPLVLRLNLERKCFREIEMSPDTWNERYNHDFDFPGAPASFLKENAHLLPWGKALDLAMGTGRNAIYLARKGYKVDDIDISEVAVEKVQQYAQKESLSINAIQKDLTQFQIAENTYEVILNFYFLERLLITQIKKGLKQGGMLIFETYTFEQPRYGRPHNPAYLLTPNELLQSFADLSIIFYHERVDTKEGESKAIASLLAQKR